MNRHFTVFRPFELSVIPRGVSGTPQKKIEILLDPRDASLLQEGAVSLSPAGAAQNEMRAESLQRHEDAMQKRIEELDRRSAELDAREAALCRYQETLDLRERQLRDLAQDMDLAAATEQRHAATLRQMSALNTDMKQAMDILRLLPELTQNMKQLSQNAAALKKAVGGSEYYDGFLKLAVLFRTVERADSPETAYLVRRLSDIMTDEFGLVKLEPRSGEPFDPDRHERQNTGSMDSFVRRCLACGWQMGESVLLPAVVETGF